MAGLDTQRSTAAPGRAPSRRRGRLTGGFLGALLLAALAAVAGPARAQQPGTDSLTPPPVIDPRPVETQPVIPGAPQHLAPQDVVVAPQPVLVLAGSATWDDAYDKLVESLKAANAELARLGLARAGDTFVAYTSSDDLGFEYEIQIPFSGTTTLKPEGGMKLGGSFAGRAIRFTHKGSFADMDQTYEQIANYLDEKNITSDDLYIEQYRTDLATTPPDALTIDILVPVQ